jgi:hypothetical protein
MAKGFRFLNRDWGGKQVAKEAKEELFKKGEFDASRRKIRKKPGTPERLELFFLTFLTEGESSVITSKGLEISLDFLAEFLVRSRQNIGTEEPV